MKKLYISMFLLSLFCLTGCGSSHLTEADAKEQLYNMQIELSKDGFDLPLIGESYSKITTKTDESSSSNETNLKFNKTVGERYFYKKRIENESDCTSNYCLFEKDQKYYNYDYLVETTNQKEYVSETDFSKAFDESLTNNDLDTTFLKQFFILTLESIKYIYIEKDRAAASNNDKSIFDISFKKINNSSFKFESTVNEVTSKTKRKTVSLFEFENYIPKNINITVDETIDGITSKRTIDTTYTWGKTEYIVSIISI